MIEGVSPFLAIPESRWLAANESAFAVADRYPVTHGHALVIPRRVIASWWEATDQERGDMLALVDEVRGLLEERFQPDGYNIGINIGEAAGQTVGHLHVHVIPRYRGDVPDPRGGVRNVIPGEGSYLAPAGSSVLVDGQERLLRDDLLRCLRDQRFDQVDLLVSFVMKSGFDLIRGGLADALDRGARLRVLTTDYLAVTDPDALARLLDLAELRPDTAATRVFQDPSVSFHPKAYLFSAADGSTAEVFVGSNNLSASGIAGGIEWAVGLDHSAPFLAAFERLWSDPRSRPLTHALLADYRQRWQPPGARATGVIPEPRAVPPAPRPVQREALTALEQTRLDGYRAGLVVMATGLGKTWLAAYDSARPQFRRVLFVAHREEILKQSLEVFRRVQPDAELGLYYGGAKQPEARVLFASVQTLAANLHRFLPGRFDYVVIDEFHHAAARSYRKVIEYFQPEFLLGLTATPDRLDGADLFALCGDNLVYECPLTDGIERGDLSPFRYFGIADDVDYVSIPWRGGRFDPEVLTQAVETQARALHALDQWREKACGRTLAFCVTVSHAEFMANFFRQNGVEAVAVHSGQDSAPRTGSIERLRAGDLQVIFTVDMFNEGLDVPEIDAVLMLRPTESPIVFLQQMGRGLRRTDGKDALTVIDFIGNHRSFLIKPRTLLGLGAGRRQPGTSKVLQAMRTGDFGLPPGCSAVFDVQLVEVLGAIARVGARSGLEEYCLSFADERGSRPTALQAFEAGYNPVSANSRHGHWFGFLEDIGLLDESEQEVVSRNSDVLAGIEKARTTKSYKLVTLMALLHLGKLRSGADVAEIAWTAHQIVIGDPRLLADTRSAKEMPDPESMTAEAWHEFWLRWPLNAWTGQLRGNTSAGWFRIVRQRFLPAFDVADELGETFDAMIQELVDYRLARYLFDEMSQIPEDGQLETAYRLKIIQARGGQPILMLNRERNTKLPEGNTPFVANDAVYTGNFASIALNVARRDGEAGNLLPDLLRSWFGADAGLPGTLHYVELVPSESHWELRPASPPSGDAQPAVDATGPDVS
jgi:superfamily II DNA or RNA helicase/diadenosine tetraphosphate (Ap4A) HIT family hydrolase/HKD family nuclease